MNMYFFGSFSQTLEKKYFIYNSYIQIDKQTFWKQFRKL